MPMVHVFEKETEETFVNSQVIHLSYLSTLNLASLVVSRLFGNDHVRFYDDAVNKEVEILQIIDCIICYNNYSSDSYF